MSRKAKKIQPESADNAENPFEKYRGIGHLGIGSGREAIIKYFRDLRGHDENDELISKANASGPLARHTKDDIEPDREKTH